MVIENLQQWKILGLRGFPVKVQGKKVKKEKKKNHNTNSARSLAQNVMGP